jgi:hypothetical protein
VPQSEALSHGDEATTECIERSVSSAMASQTNLGGNTVEMALQSAARSNA